MQPRPALALMASGLGLLALALTLLPFEPRAELLMQLDPWARLQSLRVVALCTLTLIVVASLVGWRCPRHPLALLLLAAAIGSASGTVTLVVMPEVFGSAATRVSLAQP